MEKFLVSGLKRAMMLIGAVLFAVCFAESAQAQCNYLLEQDNPDIYGFSACMSGNGYQPLYGPPTAEEMWMESYLREHATDVTSFLQMYPLAQWSWQDFYGCMAADTAMLAAGSWIAYALSVPIGAPG